ncbi:hypothetical protein ES711_10500 [Gelidibacter salicanalis]|uniref:Phage late control D family protein n=1 Tax=Gelidibacter salicanalis TaxID=291193 RepID=A0A5C7AJZ4_9FLAO|nr:hypothetical protein [Gelidibacter salicanalis]TXE07853.1 hypothetical protein ES711_10500 [Gelidibacter salicanalis]
MLKGINLTLMMGPGIAVPVPKMVIDALTNVSVTVGKAQSGFQLGFTIGKNSPLQHTLLPSGFFDPIITRVIIVVTMNGMPQVLIDGIITNHELSPSNQAGASTLTITGDDLSVIMDLVEYNSSYPSMTDNIKVMTVLAKYTALGIIPLVIPPIIPVIAAPTEKYESQYSTDKVFIQKLARRNGYVFYIDPGPLPGLSFAYFGPDISIPIPQSALSTNFDALSNVDSLTFSLDGMAKKIKVFTIYDPATKKVPIPVPLPNVNIFKPPLGARPVPIAKIETANDSSKLAVDEAARDILSFLMSGSSPSVTASGALDVLRYGKPLKSRMIVGVRGAGLTYDGLYYVDTVTHTIKAGSYKQNFTLSRDGVISNTPLMAV